jgi:Reverse transcriptase (RNA-dependent DNA polymerase)
LENNQITISPPNLEVQPTAVEPKSRYGRTLKLTQRALESKQQRAVGTVAYTSTCDSNIFALDYLEVDKTHEFDHPITYALKASNNPDTLYMHEALRAHNADNFRKAMVHEVNEHTKRGNWELVLKQDLPPGTKVLPSIWAMKRKRRIDSRETYKWKSRLNLGGHKMLKGIHYDKTYSPVVTWQSVRIFLILGNLNGWKTRQLDFVMAYTQAKINKLTYMELPQGVNFQNLSKREQFNFLKQQFTTKLGYIQSTFDECVFYKDKIIFLVYSDDDTLLDPLTTTLDERMKEISTFFEIEDQGTIQDYLGIKIRHTNSGQIQFTQPHLITSILVNLELLDSKGKTKENTSTRQLPSLVTKQIGPDFNGPPFSYNWHYRSVLGKLNFNLCCSPAGKVLHMSKEQSWPGHETSWLIPPRNQRPRYHHDPIEPSIAQMLRRR